MVRLYLIWILLFSLITLALYAADKGRAQRGRWRIAEKTLYLFGLAGGAIGGILGMKVCRHKTKHISFWLVNILGAVLQIALLVLFVAKGLW